jgi:hypothetical protein
VEWRNTEQQAQEDLDALAKKKGWKEVKNIWAKNMKLLTV